MLTAQMLMLPLLPLLLWVEGLLQLSFATLGAPYFTPFLPPPKGGHALSYRLSCLSTTETHPHPPVTWLQTYINTYPFAQAIPQTSSSNLCLDAYVYNYRVWSPAFNGNDLKPLCDPEKPLGNASCRDPRWGNGPAAVSSASMPCCPCHAPCQPVPIPSRPL